MYFDNNMHKSGSIKDVRHLQKMHFAHDHKVLLGELSKKITFLADIGGGDIICPLRPREGG